MMISLLMMLAATGDLPPAPTQLDAVPTIEKWDGRRISPKWSFDAQKAYRKGGCTSALPYQGSSILEVDVLFLIGGDGRLLKVAPVNSRCEAIDAFIGKRVTERLKHSFPASGAAEPRWMKSQVRFLWSD